ncbi:KTSC domain-containing protein [Lacrimispora sp.]|uniref:KTSC domain-containing protein n=1 Tax=Lacrimispora sp. TaxID=2719234 RepID=UPI0028A7D10D|nr:KTSC domain-containing protein [Lacrimispora sp.]
MNNYGVEMIPVRSSNVQEIGYDEENQELYVRFIKNNSLYRYNGVPIAEFYGLQNASSVGGYLNENIKKGPYAYQQLE